MNATDCLFPKNCNAGYPHLTESGNYSLIPVQKGKSHCIVLPGRQKEQYLKLDDCSQKANLIQAAEHTAELSNPASASAGASMRAEASSDLKTM